MNYLKYLWKTKMLYGWMRMLAWCIPGAQKKEGIAVLNLEAIGDVVLWFGVLKQYRGVYPTKKITVFIKKEIQLADIIKANEWVDDVIQIEYKKFLKNPLYSASVVYAIRKAGYEMFINNDFTASEIVGKMITITSGAARTVGYEGMEFERVTPFNGQQKRNIAFIDRHILPKYDKLISAIDKNIEAYKKKSELPHCLYHYKKIFEESVGRVMPEYTPDIKKAATSHVKFPTNKYVVINPGASVGYKRWPLKRFSAVGRLCVAMGYDVVLVGSRAEEGLASILKQHIGGTAVSYAGKTSMSELVEVIRNASMVVTNDTGTSHIAIATETPAICIVGGGQFGMFCGHGDVVLQQWVYQKTPCYLDNWRCGIEAIQKNVSSPCIDCVSESAVIEKAKELFEQIKVPARTYTFCIPPEPCNTTHTPTAQ